MFRSATGATASLDTTINAEAAEVAEKNALRGIRGSPVLLVNGKRIDGVPSEKMLTELVGAALAAKPVSERAEGGRQ